MEVDRSELFTAVGADLMRRVEKAALVVAERAVTSGESQPMSAIVDLVEADLPERYPRPPGDRAASDADRRALIERMAVELIETYTAEMRS